MAGATSDPVIVALDEYIMGGRTFDSLADVAEQFGGDTPAGRRALADAAGVSERTVQRWFVAPGEINPRTGRPKERREFTRARAAGQARAQARRRFVSTRIGEIRRRGFGMRLVAQRRVSASIRVQEMPASAGGIPSFVDIPGGRLSPVLNSWLAGEYEDAADELVDVFFETYGLIPDELGEIVLCQLR